MVLSDNFPSTGAAGITGLHVDLVPLKSQTSELSLHDILILMRLAKSKHLLNKTLNHETPLHIFRQLLKNRLSGAANPDSSARAELSGFNPIKTACPAQAEKAGKNEVHFIH